MKIPPKKFKHWLTKRYQIVIRDDADLAERSTIRLSYPTLIISILFLWIFFTGVSWFVSRVLLKQLLDPDYKIRQQDEKIQQLYEDLTRLEQHNAEQEKLLKNFQHVLGVNLENTELKIDDELVATAEEGKDLPDPIIKNSRKITSDPIPLPFDFTNNDVTEKKTYQRLADVKPYQFPPLSLITPLDGRITISFDLTKGHYGIDMAGVQRAPIRAVAAGRVMLANWTLETGWLLIIQHNQGLVSVYKHNETLFKTEGSTVKAGEVVALMGNTGEFSTGPHLHFELWHNGEPLNPEDFIIF